VKLRLIRTPAVSEPVSAPLSTVRAYDPRLEKERALASLVPVVRATVYRMLGPAASRDDVMQDALIAIARALDGFEGRSSLETYARTITVRVAYRAIGRVKARACEPLSDDLAEQGPSPERALSEEQTLRNLHRCLERLPESRRMAFILCGIEEMSPQDAAALVGTTPGAMRARYMHARRELARMLSPKAKGASDAP